MSEGGINSKTYTGVFLFLEGISSLLFLSYFIKLVTLLCFFSLWGKIFYVFLSPNSMRSCARAPYIIRYSKNEK